MKSITLEHALAMLRAAPGPSPELQRAIPLAFFDRADYPKVGTLVSNACGENWPIDACIELVGYLLPDAYWIAGKGKVRPDEPMFGARILEGETPIGEGESDHLPIAFLIAIFSALVAKAAHSHPSDNRRPG
jgi:hypothetical protein